MCEYAKETSTRGYQWQYIIVSRRTCDTNITIQIDRLYVWVQCTEAHKDQQRNIKTREVESWKEAKKNQQQYCSGNDTRLLLLNKERCVFSVLRLRYLCVLKKSQCINSRTSDRNIWRVVELKILIASIVSIFDIRCAVQCCIWHTENCYLILVLLCFFFQCPHNVNRIDGLENSNFDLSSQLNTA